MKHRPPSHDSVNRPFDIIMSVVEEAGAPHVLHEHEPTRTIDDARKLSLDIERIVKTVAFGLRDGRLVLAALRGTRRVDYPRLAALAGVTRRDVAALSPAEVLDRLGVEPGCVSPAPLGSGALVLFDEDALHISPTVYCGVGRADRTLEIAPLDLARLSGARVGSFSK